MMLFTLPPMDRTARPLQHESERRIMVRPTDDRMGNRLQSSCYCRAKAQLGSVEIFSKYSYIHCNFHHPMLAWGVLGIKTAVKAITP
jgi:hypothetical protein